MKIWKQYLNSFGDIFFENYFLTKELALSHRPVEESVQEEGRPRGSRWVLEEIEVKQ